MLRQQFALEFLDEADEIALTHFRHGRESENKDKAGFDPVTAADKAIEERFRLRLRSQYPNDGIQGEEYDDLPSTNGMEWVIDPIDGTRAFLVGAPSFTTLLALNTDNGTEFAAISQPFTGERFVTDSRSTTYRYRNIRRNLKVASTTDLADAVLLTTFPEIGTTDELAAFTKVAKAVKLTRYGLDAYGYALLAMGTVDLVIEAGLKPFDYMAPAAIIRAAGGVVTNWEGNEPSGTDRILAAATPEIHQAAMALLS